VIELLAIPGWQTPPTTLEEWVRRLADLAGLPVELERESPQATWIMLPALRLRGFAMLAGPHVEAINFEVAEPDPTRATSLIAAAATALAWEIHAEDEGEDDADEDDG
jgi:hypothetical protein